MRKKKKVEFFCAMYMVGLTSIWRVEDKDKGFENEVVCNEVIEMNLSTETVQVCSFPLCQTKTWSLWKTNEKSTIWVFTSLVLPPPYHKIKI